MTRNFLDDVQQELIEALLSKNITEEQERRLSLAAHLRQWVASCPIPKPPSPGHVETAENYDRLRGVDFHLIELILEQMGNWIAANGLEMSVPDRLRAVTVMYTLLAAWSFPSPTPYKRPD